jgi:hypothetical protein
MSDIVRVQTIHNQQSKELLHHEMSLVEREPHVNDGIRRQGPNSFAALTVRKRSCHLPSRATEGSTASNTKSASEASVFNRISCNETAAGKVRDLERLVKLLWACRESDMTEAHSSWTSDGSLWGRAGRLTIHGFVNGTLEPSTGRRSSLTGTPRRLVTATRGHRASIVVRGRESRSHGEGKQVVRQSDRKEK